jgi:hypothetical protein
MHARRLTSTSHHMHLLCLQAHPTTQAHITRDCCAYMPAPNQHKLADSCHCAECCADMPHFISTQAPRLPGAQGVLTRWTAPTALLTSACLMPPRYVCVREVKAAKSRNWLPAAQNAGSRQGLEVNHYWHQQQLMPMWQSLQGRSAQLVAARGCLGLDACLAQVPRGRLCSFTCEL